MKKTVLGVALVVVFCIAWVLVAGEAWQASKEEHWKGAHNERFFQYAPGTKILESHTDAEWANINVADAHWRTQASWGIGAGLLADVLLLVGVLAWQKITFKS